MGTPKKAASRGVAYTNVLLEQIRAEGRATLEAVKSMEQSLRRDFGEQFARVNERLSNLEAAVMQNSRDIQRNSEDIRKNSEDIRKNSEDIQRLDAEVAGLRDEIRRLRHDFDTREERARIADLEARVTKLERRSG